MLRYALTTLRANVTRFVATALAVIIGVGFLAAGLMLTDAMRVALSGNVQRQYAGVDVVVEPAASLAEFGASVPADVLSEVAATPGVTAAAGELSATAAILDRTGASSTPRAKGRAWIPEAQLNPLTIEAGRAPTADGEVVVDRGTAADNDLHVGSTVRLGTPAGPSSATVVGISGFGRTDSVDPGGTLSFAPATSLRLLSPGSPAWNAILVAAKDPATTMTALRHTLPQSLEITSGHDFRASQQDADAGFIDLLRPVLQGFAYLALFVCGFVIFNTFSVVVTQRFRELALIRAVGGTPGQVRRSLVLEGAVVGFVSSAVGVAFGAALAVALQAVLGAFDIKLPGSGVALSTGTVVLCLVVGTVVTVLSVIVPAVRAGRTKPVEAMRDAAVDRSGASIARAVIGGACLVAAIVLLLADRFGTASGWFLGPGSLLLFVGLVVGGPLVARLFASLLRIPARRSGVTARLAVDNAGRNPKRTATTANALVIGLFLVTLVTVSGDALKTWTVERINALSSSDFIVTGDRSGVAPDLVAQMRTTKGVADIGPVSQAGVLTTSGEVALVSGADIDELRRTTGLEVRSGSLEDVAAGRGAAVTDLGGASTSGGGGAGPGSDRSIAATPGRLGESIELVSPDGSPVGVDVLATLEPKLDTLLLGTLLDRERFTAVAGEHPVTSVFVRVEPGQAEAVGRRLDRLVATHAGTQVQPGNFIGEIVSQIFDFLIGAVNALLGMSVVIALVGIVNTITLSIFERRRELGMLRALGMTRRQVAWMVRTEAVLIGLLGTIIGVGAGLLLGWVMIGSLPGHIPLNVNWTRLALIALVGVLAGVIASIAPARRATRIEMVEAMATT
ncbi:MAG: ABC transporter permease [Actinobacteria bacterium]|nr:ABC transporter permease [Actinomycetota bacterium]